MSRAQPGAQRRGWKAQPAAAGLSRGQRSVLRILLPLAVLAILAAIGWWILQRIPDPPQLNLQLVSVDQYETGQALPNEFAIPDASAIGRAAGLSNAEILNRANDADSLRRLADNLGKSKKDGPLLLYLNAHGIAIGEQPVLLASDLRVSRKSPGNEQPTDGTLPLATWLRALADCQAPVKLLVLDAGRVEFDPVAGLVWNTFPDLVERAVQDLSQQDNLWVIVSNSAGQRSHVSPLDQRSAFAYFLAEGLRGAADGFPRGSDSARPEDRLIEIGELFGYVQARVERWVLAASASLESQTPILLRSGVGRVEWQDPQAALAVICTIPAPAPPGDPQNKTAADRPEPTDPKQLAAADERLRSDLALALALPSPGLAADTEAPPATPTGAAASPPPSSGKGSSPSEGAAAKSSPSTPSADGKSEAPGPTQPAGNSDQSGGANAPAGADAAPGAAASKTEPAPPAPVPSPAAATQPDGAAGDSSAPVASPSAAPTTPPSGALAPVNIIAPLTDEVWFPQLTTSDRSSKQLLKVLGQSLDGPASDSSRWTPRDYAPHLWRISLHLFGELRRAEVGRALARRALPDASLPDRPQDWSRLADRFESLQPAATRFERSVARDSLSAAGLAAAVRARDAACDQLGPLVETAFQVARHPDFAGELTGFDPLLDALGQLCAALEAIPDASPAGDPAERWNAWRNEVLQLSQQVDSLRRERRESLNRAIVKLAELPPAKVPGLLLYDLLASPILDLPARKSVASALAQWRVPLGPQLATLDDATRADLAKRQRRDGWTRHAARHALELRLAALVLGEQPPRSTAAGVYPDQPGERIARAALLGLPLAGQYQKIAAAVEKDLPATQSSTRTQSERLLRLGGVPFAVAAEKALADIPFHPVLSLELSPPQPRRKPQLVRSPSQPGPLEITGPLALSWTLSRDKLPAAGVLSYKYDEQRLEVFDDSGTRLSPGRRQIVFPAGRSEFELRLKLVPKDSLGPGERTQFELVWNDAPPLTDSLWLVRPDQWPIALSVDGPPGTVRPNLSGSSTAAVPWNSLGAARVELRPFQDRPNDFQFSLASSADKPTPIKVRIYALRDGELSSSSSGATADRPEFAESPGRKPLHEETVVVQNGKPARLNFSKKAAPPASPPATPAPPPSPPPAPTLQPPAGEDVSAGLVCLLEQSGVADKRAIWIDIRPFHPGDHLVDPRAVCRSTDDDSVKRIELDLVAKPEWLPRNPPERAVIELAVDVWPRAAKVGKGFVAGKLAPGATRQTLAVSVDAEKALSDDSGARFVFVELSVDRYPRARIFKVQLIDDGTRYVPSAFALRPREDLRRFLKKDQRQQVPFPFSLDMPWPTQNVAYEFRAQLAEQIGATKEVQELPPTRLDRKLSVLSLKSDDPAQLRLQSKIEDAFPPLDLSRYENQVIAVAAQIAHASDTGTSDDLPQDRVEFVLDDLPPEVAPLEKLTVATKGQPLVVEAAASDPLSDVEKVEYAFKLAPPSPDAKASPGPKRSLAAPLEALPLSGGRYRIPLPPDSPDAEYTVWVQATDRAGNASEPVPAFRVRVVPPVTESAKTDAPAKPRRITGKLANAANLRKGEVKLTPPKAKQSTVAASDDGAFEFQDVPPGEYEIKGSGRMNNIKTFEWGPETVKVESASPDPIRVTIPRK